GVRRGDLVTDVEPEVVGPDVIADAMAAAGERAVLIRARRLGHDVRPAWRERQPEAAVRGLGRRGHEGEAGEDAERDEAGSHRGRDPIWHVRINARAVPLVRMQSPMRVDLNLPEDRVGPRPRRPSKRVWVGGVPVGDGAPIAVQSMCTTLTHDVEATIRQIERLQEAGCEIVRVAVPDRRAREALKELVRRSILPVVADLHFDY